MITFKSVAQLFQNLDDISSRLEMMELLGEFYKEVTPEEAAILSYLLLGRLSPMFVSSEFNFSEKSVENALGSYVMLEGADLEVIKLRKSLGDIGLVAEEVSITIGGKYDNKLSLIGVYAKLWELMKLSGSGSVEGKSALFIELFKQNGSIANKYLAKIVSGKMRLGASVSTVIEALSYSREGDKSKVDNLKQFYGAFADVGVLAHRVISGGDIEKVIPVMLGIPVKARLVERVKGFEEVFERLGEEVIVQPKFDGLRCQAHVGVDEEELEKQLFDAVWIKYYEEEIGQIESLGMFGEVEESSNRNKNKIQLFSRNLEPLTDMFPEIVEALKELDCKSCILDGEIEGFDPETGGFLNFQETITRKRKYEVEKAIDEVPVKYYVFDIIELNGRDLTEVDTVERVEILKKLMQKKPDLIELADTWTVSTVEELHKKFDSSVGDGLEGLVVKQRNGGYRPGVRNYEWIKLKKSMDKALVDSVDVVIMGYYYGSGKKTALGIGAMLGGVLNKETGEIESVTKVGTGVTDELWRTIIVRLDELVIESIDMVPKMYSVAKEMYPDVWVVPEVVCSIEADEVTKSKLHRAGCGGSDRGLGYALRFPRLIEFDRDKGVDDTTSLEELIGMSG